MSDRFSPRAAAVRLALVALASGLAALPVRAQWTQTSGPTGGPLHYLAAPDGALLGTPGGPLFRFDGAAWSSVEDLSAGALLAAGTDVYAEASGELMHSGDAGLTFAPVAPDARHARLLNMDGPRVVATAWDTLFVSGDGGATWDRYRDDAWVSFNGSPFFRVGLSNIGGAAVEGDAVFAAATAYIFGGVYRLAAADTAWVPVLDLGQQVFMRSMARHDGRLFVGSTVGVHVSSDGGATWTAASSGLPGTLGGGVTLHPGTSALFAEVSGAFFRWTGTTWTALPLFPAAFPLSVAAGDRLYGATAAGVYALAAGVWTPVPPHVGTTPYPLDADGQTAVVRADGRLFRTDDVGATWVTLTDLAGLAYAEGDLLIAVGPGGLIRSADGGQTWAPAGPVALPPEYAHLKPAGFAGYDGAVFAAYAGARFGDHGEPLSRYGGVFRTDDGGASWTDVSAGLPMTSLGRSPVRLIASAGVRLFAQTEHGCATSSGATWTTAACPTGSTGALVDAGGRWLALTSQGVYASDNLGTTWTAATGGLPAPPGFHTFWTFARMTSIDGAPFLVSEDAGTTRAYRYDGAAWETLGLVFPAGARWTGFAGSAALLYGGTFFQGVWTTTLSPVAVSAAPVSPPVVIPPAGGAFDFAVTLTNTSDQPQTFDVWTAVTGPLDRSPVLGPRAVTLAPGATVTRTLTQQVPGNAPAGAYTYAVNVGAFPGVVLASDVFPVTKQGSPGAAPGAGADDWTTSGWDASGAANAAEDAGPEGFALAPPAPNPFDGPTLLRFSVGAAGHVRLAVYDALGREVAVLADGPLEAGRHEVAFDGLRLPSGLYVVRMTTEGGFSQTRRLTRLR
jgi:photosystem II stability/assembly factor-like uncharacterized protein